MYFFSTDLLLRDQLFASSAPDAPLLEDHMMGDAYSKSVTLPAPGVYILKLHSGAGISTTPYYLTMDMVTDTPVDTDSVSISDTGADTATNIADDTDTSAWADTGTNSVPDSETTSDTPSATSENPTATPKKKSSGCAFTPWLSTSTQSVIRLLLTLFFQR